MDRRQFIRGSALVAAATTTSLVSLGCSTDWISTAIQDLPTAENIVQSLAAIIAAATGNALIVPAVSALIDAAIKSVSLGLSTLQSLITGYKVTKDGSILDKIDAALTDLQSNLSSIFEIAGIKNTSLQTAIFTAVGLLISVVSAIQTLIPAAPAASSLRKAGPNKLRKVTIIPTADQIRSQVNAVFVLKGFDAFQVVK